MLKLNKIIPFICATILCSLLLTNANARNLDQVRWKPLPGTVALTFDDGPSPIYTPKILAILKKYQVKATFFVMGWAAKKYPKLIKQMVRDGHAVAIHTNSHSKLTRLSNKQLYKEVDWTRDVVAKVAGVTPVCLRPPFGLANSRVKKYIRSRGMIPVPMGFNSFDYMKPGVNKIIQQVVGNAIKGRVFLLHDGYFHRQQTVAALPKIIEGIRKKGLGFSAICYPCFSARACAP